MKEYRTDRTHSCRLCALALAGAHLGHAAETGPAISYTLDNDAKTSVAVYDGGERLVDLMRDTACHFTHDADACDVG